MIASLRADLTKLARRPAVWVLGAAWVIAEFVFGYLISYLLLGSETMAQAGMSRQDVLPTLLPEGFVGNVVGGFPQFGLAVALVLGGLAVGSEYGWGTIGTTLVQRPTRTAVLAGRALAVTVVAALLTLAPLAVGAGASLGVAALESQPVAWPAAADLLQGLGSGWLILVVGGMLGLTLATWLRSTGLAVGLGLVYVLVVESLFAGFAGQSTVIEAVAKLLPGVNAGGLAAALATVVPEAAGAPGVSDLVGAPRAALTLGVELAVLLGIGLLVFHRRDVTA